MLTYHQQLQMKAFYKGINIAAAPHIGMRKEKPDNWMNESNYGFSDDFIVRWTCDPQYFWDSFIFEENAKAQFNELLIRGEAPLNTLLNQATKTVNESYYGEDNAGFYKMRMLNGKSAIEQTRFFLDNAKNEKRKPTAIKNGNCRMASYELEHLLYKLGLDPQLWTMPVLVKNDLPKEYQTEEEKQFFHQHTLVYDGNNTNWALLNSYTPRNNDTIIPKERIPHFTLTDRLD